MPRLSKHDPLIEGLPEELAIQLPDVDEIVSDVGAVPGVMSTITEDVAYTSAQIYQSAGQICAGQIAVKLGVMSVQTMGAITKALGEDVIEQLDDALASQTGSLTSAIAEMSQANEILNAGLQAGIGLSINLMSTIPVVGWIAKLAWTVGNAIRDIVQIVRQSREDDAPPQYPATSFNPEFDRDQLNKQVLRRLRTTHDWTQMFRPPGGGIPEHAAWLDQFWTAHLEGGGRRVTATNVCDNCLGYVPGTAFLHKSTELFGIALKDTGNVYLPSSRQHGLWLWKHISRANSPALYTLDADTIGTAWHNYLQALREYVSSDHELSAAQRERIISYYDRGGDDPSSDLKIFGWGSVNNPTSPSNYLPVKEAKILKERQLAFLDTLTVAYVDESYGALSDGDVRSKWEKRRKDLLAHPAICDVDLDMIPDAIYRGQVEYEQDLRKAECKFLGPQSLALATVAPPPTGQDGAAGVDGFKGVDHHGRNWWLIGLLAAGTGAAAYHYRDDLRRKFDALRERMARRR